MVIRSTKSGSPFGGIFSRTRSEGSNPPIATYNITANVSSLNEGSAVTFTINTTGVNDGTTLYWTTNVVSGTINTSDFSDSSTSGSFTITSDTGTVVRTLSNDATTEGTESFQLQIRTGSTSGGIVATSATITISDTSLDPTYSVSPSPTTVNEGSAVTFTVSTTDVPNGTTLYWTTEQVSGTINSSDFSGGATSGSFTINSNSGSIVRTLANDLTTEGSEVFRLQIRTGSTSGTVVATSANVTVNDTSVETYSVSPSTSSVNEGSSVTFTVTTGGVPDGTTLYWSTNTVSGTVNGSDFSGGATTGSFTITSNSGSIVRTIANDATTEGSESFQLQIRTGSTSGTVVATSTTVTINDTSLTPFSATGGTKLSPGNGFIYHIWTSPGSLTVSAGDAPSTQLLVVGGGGDGGVCGGGGGGGGGIVYHPTLPIPGPYTYPVTVGSSPGNSRGSPCGYMSAGNDSSFNRPGSYSLVGKGGGQGGGADSQAGLPGGSGGGNSYPGDTPGQATQPGQSHPGAPPGWSNYGNPGGNSPNSAPGKGGGGSGGAGGPSFQGGNAASFPAFPGPLFGPMPGTWQSEVGTGGKFAGGGGGSPGPNNTDTAEGGGGTAPSGAAVANTGGGGGGGGTAQAGASGVVILRYPSSI